jgi:hypothetical protein
MYHFNARNSSNSLRETITVGRPQINNTSGQLDPSSSSTTALQDSVLRLASLEMIQKCRRSQAIPSMINMYDLDHKVRILKSLEAATQCRTRVR